MKFAHFSDCHLGSWNNHPELRELSTKTFEASIDSCIAEGVDFILISGDLFDTSLPPYDILRRAVVKLRQCKEASIAVYAIAGSHDFSPTGKTFLGILEDAGLLSDVAGFSETDGKIKLGFAIDKKTGAKITGIAGRIGGLERKDFEILDKSIENEPGYKIFLLHSAIEEYKPKRLTEMKALPLSLLPKNFNYYAAGHVHARHESEYGGGKVVFPGPTFPTEFTELENFCAGFYIVDADKNSVTPQDVKLCNVALVDINADNKMPQQIAHDVMKRMDLLDLGNAILLVKLEGVMNGSMTDIDFRSISTKAAEKGAVAVKRNISKLSSREFEEVKVDKTLAIEELERELIREHSGKIRFPYKGEAEITLSLMDSLKEEKQEGETNETFEERTKSNAKKILGLE